MRLHLSLITGVVITNLFLAAFVSSFSMNSNHISSGWSSSDVVVKIRNTLSNGYKAQTGAKCKIKVGHGGTLDPLAEGVLVVGVGKGTKLLDDFLRGPKGYQAMVELGTETDTYDRLGNVTESSNWHHVSYDTLESALPAFRGDILQVPPMYSALKRDGKKLYELARAGIEVEREARAVTVYSLNIIKHYKDQPIELPHFGLDLECSGGFYVRSVIRDIARACNTRGNMMELLRYKQGGFTLSDCLQEADWKYDIICNHIRKCSSIVGLECDTLTPATGADMSSERL